ncbi:MAG TPA: carboxylating nicotinate-nucleotide diphosphorylase [Gemmatimonadaceae bacterium]|nr:carboxylating nicotinate-nucleotide diphosphorylase [Gemmatimonadaceae bacterium]
MSPRSRRIAILAERGFSPPGPLRFPFARLMTTSMVRDALAEDAAENDITTIATIVSGRRARAAIVAREDGVIAGTALAREAFKQRDPRASVRPAVKDGQRVSARTPVLFVTAHSLGLLSAERVALNFMQRLSGIASLTHQFVDAVAGTKAKILDTRKTTPGWRKLEKYAVRAGGGLNHRADLASAVLIKDNHIAAIGGDVAMAITRAREVAPEGTSIEVECDTLEQVRTAVDAGPDIIMLDNMDVGAMREAVGVVDGRAVTEASGGVTLETVRGIAETGVDWISVGAITHSVKALNLALDF